MRHSTKNKDNITLKEMNPPLYEFIQDLMEEVEGK